MRVFSPLSAVVLSLPLLPFLPGCESLGHREAIDFQESAAASGIRRLVVSTRNGSVLVECAEGLEEVAVTGAKYARGKDAEDARTAAESIEIVVPETPDEEGTLRIEARFPGDLDRRSAGARFQIRAPRGVAIDLSTSNGDVAALDPYGEVKLRTSNGKVQVRGAKDVHARSSNGAIRVEDASGAVDVETSNGAIHLAKVGPGPTRAVTSNGRIVAEALRGDAELRSSNGSVRLEAAELSEKPDLVVTTSNGPVSVSIPKGADAELEMRTSNGRVRADLVEDGAQVTKKSDRELHARLGEGRGRIRIRSSNASIDLASRAGEEARG